MRALVIAFVVLISLTAAGDARLDEALKLLDEHDVPEQDDHAALQKWPAGGKDLWVVAAIYGDSVVRAAVLRDVNGTFERVARSEGEEPVTNEANLWVPGIKLDLIPYRISPKDLAFGVRVANSYTSTARFSSSEALHLYRLHDGKLSQVFAELTLDYNYDKPDEGEDEEEGEESVREAVVIISPKKQKGFYDVLLRDRQTKETIRYRWDGQKYARE